MDGWERGKGKGDGGGEAPCSEEGQLPSADVGEALHLTYGCGRNQYSGCMTNPVTRSGNLLNLSQRNVLEFEFASGARSLFMSSDPWVYPFLSPNSCPSTSVGILFPSTFISSYSGACVCFSLASFSSTIHLAAHSAGDAQGSAAHDDAREHAHPGVCI